MPDIAALAARPARAPGRVGLAAAGTCAASPVLGFPVKSFEGFLRPETYALPFGDHGDETGRA